MLKTELWNREQFSYKSSEQQEHTGGGGGPGGYGIVDRES